MTLWIIYGPLSFVSWISKIKLILVKTVCKSMQHCTARMIWDYFIICHSITFLVSMFDAPRMSFLRLSTLLTFLLSWSWCLSTNQSSVMSVLANQRPVLIALTNQRSVVIKTISQSEASIDSISRSEAIITWSAHWGWHNTLTSCPRGPGPGHWSLSSSIRLLAAHCLQILQTLCNFQIRKHDLMLCMFTQ